MDGMVILKKEGRKVFMMLALCCLLGVCVIWKRCRVSVAKGFASFFIQNPFSIFLSQQCCTQYISGNVFEYKATVF